MALGKSQLNVLSRSSQTDTNRRKSKDLNLDEALIPTLKHWYVYQLFYPWALFFVKASILALYHRIFTHHNFRRWVYCAAGFIVIQTITVTFVNVFECGANPSRAWDSKFPQGCINMSKMYFSNASVNIVTDVVILVMPLKVFKQLNMNLRTAFPTYRNTVRLKLSWGTYGSISGVVRTGGPKKALSTNRNRSTVARTTYGSYNFLIRQPLSLFCKLKLL
ncbi:hypothetical protein IG631_07693 [Alternaria alternata]|nr:hypothetical protein IG631_07693 [Alternaria alternata]